MIRKINDINLRNYNYGAASVSHTGSVTQTKLMSILIPANTFMAGDLINMEAILQKTGTSGSIYWRFYWNSSDTINGAIQLAVRGIRATNRFTVASRRMSIRTANGGGSTPEVGTELIDTTTGFYNEFNSGAISNVALNWTIDSYLMTSIVLGNASDTVIQNSLKIWTY